MKQREAAEAHSILSRFDRQSTVLGHERDCDRDRDRTDGIDKYKYWLNRRPPGIGHLTNHPELSKVSVVHPGDETGLFWEDNTVTWDPFACGTRPVFLAEYSDWYRQRIMVNKTSFATTHLPWITCEHCLVLIDWGMTCGYLELKEVADPLPDETARKKLRKEWRRLLRARREPVEEKK